MLGPLYGIVMVWLTSRWQDVFWINVPLALVAMVMIHFSLPRADRSADPEKVDLVGGLLLAVTLGLASSGCTTRRRTASTRCRATARRC